MRAAFPPSSGRTEKFLPATALTLHTTNDVCAIFLLYLNLLWVTFTASSLLLHFFFWSETSLWQGRLLFHIQGEGQLFIFFWVSETEPLWDGFDPWSESLLKLGELWVYLNSAAIYLFWVWINLTKSCFWKLERIWGFTHAYFYGSLWVGVQPY